MTQAKMAAMSVDIEHEKDLREPAMVERITRVILWCVPRSCSTAFLKCMTYVPDSQVWLEPYLNICGFSKYGRHRDELVKFLQEAWGCNSEGGFAGDIKEGYLAGDKPYSWVKEQLEASPTNKKLIFSKDMCEGLDDHYEALPEGCRHTFLIRHPYKVFNSWERMINRGIDDSSKKVKLTELPECLIPKGYFFKEQYDFYLYVKKNIDPNPVIIDTDDLLENPGRVLKGYCEAVGIPYSDDLLKWKPGRECMDELWMVAKEIILAQNTGNHHKETFASTGFGNPTKCPDRSELSADVLFCSDRCLKFYKELYDNRLKC